jgi:hypothetical protein
MARLIPTLVLVLGALLLAPALSPGGGLEAQVRPGERAPELVRRVQQQFERRIRTDLGLTEGEFQEMQMVVAGFRPRRVALNGEERTLRAQAQQLVRRGEDSEADNVRARELLRAIQRLREAEAALAREEEARLAELLTPMQLLRYQLLRQQLAERIRQLQGPGAPGGYETP